MKTWRNIYLVVGILLIFLNCCMTFSMYKNYQLADIIPDIYGIAYMIGNQFMTITGIIILIGAYRIQRNINREKREALENSFSESDNQQ